MTLTFTFEKNTRNYVKYSLISPPGVVETFGTIYIAKENLGNKPPSTLVFERKMQSDTSS